jgi:predicted nucleotidyltransferase
MNFNEFKIKVEPVFRRYDVVKAALFGSMARGESTEDSDVDLLVEFKGDKSLLDLAGLKVDIEELIGRRVDVLTYSSIHPLLRERILREQKVLI